LAAISRHRLGREPEKLAGHTAKASQADRGRARAGSAKGAYQHAPFGST